MLRWLKRGFAGLSIGSVLLAVYFMTTAGHNIQEALDVVAIQTGSRVEKPDIKSYQGDRLSWRLQARSAQEKQDALQLEQPMIELYTDAGEVISIQGEQGIYRESADVIDLQGRVQVGYQGWVIRSERLNYQQKQQVVHIPSSFDMQRDGIHIQGKGMRIEKNKGMLQVEQGVHMRIEETR